MAKTGRLQARVDEKDLEQWKESAESEGLSLSAWIAMCLNDRAKVISARRDT